MGKSTIVVLDADGDKEQRSFETVNSLDDGSNYAANKTLHNALMTALMATLIGEKDVDAYSGAYDELNAVAPGNKFAQKNTRWVLEYVVTGTTNVLTYSIGTANIGHADAVIANGRVELPIGTGVGAALKTAFEAAVREGGSNVTLQAIYHQE